MDVEGNNFAQVGTKSLSSTTGVLFVTELGGDDTIQAGAGTKRVFGGDGADTITLGVGEHTVSGDNATVTYVAIGQVGAGRLLRYDTTDTVQLTGGVDLITVGDGDATIAGGMFGDTIAAGNGTQTILGDNGFVQMDVEGNNFAQVGTKSLSSTTGVLFVTELGGDDTIQAGAGTKRVLAGDGADTVTLGTGDHTVFGDNGYVTYVAIGQVGAGNALTYATTDTVPGTAGNDTITVGDGNNTIFGGMGLDTITTGNGMDTILGDNGIVQMEATGTLFLMIESTVTLEGGDDFVVAGDGDKTVIAGIANDTVTVGTGTHTIFGDNGAMVYSSTGLRESIATTELLQGGNDTIFAAGGDTVVLAGLGADTVTTGAGSDVLIGDDGYVILDSAGRIALIETTEPTSGGADVLTAGAGNDVILGGFESDTLLGGDGNDYVLGDLGRVAYAGGVVDYVETIDPYIGKADYIDGGNGSDVLFGGDGDDFTVGNLTDDVLAGDYATVDFSGADHIVSLIRYGTASDLIANMQGQIFTFTRPSDGATAVVQVFRTASGSSGLPGATFVEEMRLRDFLILPTLAGFEFSSQAHHSSSSSQSGQSSGTGPSETQGSGQAPGKPPAEPQGTTEDSGQGQNQETAPSGDGGTPAGEGGPPSGEGQPNPPGEGADIGTVPSTEAPAAPDGMPNLPVVGLEGESHQRADTNGGRFEIAAAGILGGQAVNIGRRIFAAPEAAQQAGDRRNGRWIPAEPGAREAMLDRRAKPRPEASTRLQPGAIDDTAQKWLDSALGLHSNVQTSNYRTAGKPRMSIDWGSSKPTRDGETK